MQWASAGMSASIARIASFLLLVFPDFLQAQEIKGDCNVLAPQMTAQGPVTFSVTCNNISQETATQLQKIMELIDKTSKGLNDDELRQGLSSILTKSQDTLNEITRSRAPEFALSSHSFTTCSVCSDPVEINNIGGLVSKVIDFRVHELSILNTFSGGQVAGTDSNGVAFVRECPFLYLRDGAPKSFSDGLDFNVEFYNVQYQSGKIEPGETLGTIDFPKRFHERSEVKPILLRVYSEYLHNQYGLIVVPDTLSQCIDYEPVLIAIEIVVENYQGIRFEQFYVFFTEQSGVTPEGKKIIDLKTWQRVLDRGRFDEILSRYDDQRDFSSLDDDEENVGFYSPIIANFLINKSTAWKEFGYQH